MPETVLTPSIVVVGGGHAGAALCHELASAGVGTQVHLVCAEPDLPYQRPPLSKAFLKSANQTLQPLRGEPWFAEAGITLHRGEPGESIDRSNRCLELRSGRKLSYNWLVLATGTRARTLPSLPSTLHNVAVLRSSDDATRLRTLLASASHVIILGGGFIGLEIAATANASGKQVTVIEAAPRLLGRSVSQETAQHLLATHRSAGIEILCNSTVERFETQDGRLVALIVNGRRHAVEVLVLGIGAQPNVELAEAAGLACDDGVLVDRCMRTSDPAILAIGDVARFPGEHGETRRLESVQNANDQARTAASTIVGPPQPYAALPWFWSDQGTVRLQIAGLMPARSRRHLRPGPKPGSFSILHYQDDVLVCVESLNAPADHLAARKLLNAQSSLPPELACDSTRPLGSVLPPAETLTENV